LRHNKFGQPVGPRLDGWSAVPRPGTTPLHGSDVVVRPWVSDDCAGLFDALCGDGDASRWTYLSADMPRTLDTLTSHLAATSADPAAQVMTIVDAATGAARGTASYLAVREATGSVEVGAITLGPSLAGSRGSTEAMYLMAQHAFALGYRRYEWKCDSLNAPSVRAALRLGFTPEGVHRNALVLKDRSRDTAWFSITDAEWPVRRQRLESWLAPTNFDGVGRQRRRLADFGDVGGEGDVSAG